MNDQLNDALGSVHLTALQAECPAGAYMVDLLVARAIIDPRALLRDERHILDAVKAVPDLAEALHLNNPNHTSYLYLGHLLGDQRTALRLMAALVTLRRAALLTMLSAHELMPVPEDWEPPSYERALEAAGRGFVSLLDVNLNPDPDSIYNPPEGPRAD